MGQFSRKVHQLRGFFMIYTLVRLAVEIILARGITRDLLNKLDFQGISSFAISPAVLIILITVITGALFALGLWLFYNLLQKKDWARIVLLVAAWLVVADAIFSLLLTSGTTEFSSWLTRLIPGLDWQRVLLIDRLKDILGLIFWGYLILVLQFDQRVKRDFHNPPDSQT